jgi:hypothetical protein
VSVRNVATATETIMLQLAIDEQLVPRITLAVPAGSAAPNADGLASITIRPVSRELVRYAFGRGRARA